MTKAQVERTVRLWQKQLGLESWEIVVEWADPAGADCDADTWRSNDYDRAKIRFAPDFAKWTDVFTKRIVVHELLHLVTRDMDRVFADLEDNLHRDVYAQSNRRYEHELEGLVDRLSYRLVDLCP